MSIVGEKPDSPQEY